LAAAAVPVLKPRTVSRLTGISLSAEKITLLGSQHPQGGVRKQDDDQPDKPLELRRAGRAVGSLYELPRVLLALWGKEHRGHDEQYE
jgi:hypothetical protein